MGNILRKKSDPIFSFPPAKSSYVQNFDIFIATLRNNLKKEGIKTVLEKINDDTCDFIAYRDNKFVELHFTSNFVGSSPDKIQYIGGKNWINSGRASEGVINNSLLVTQILESL